MHGTYAQMTGTYAQMKRRADDGEEWRIDVMRDLP